VNYYLTDGSKSPYAASLLGNLKHWITEDREIQLLIKKLQAIRREDICK
jgi:ArsR family transcriptional regulator